MNNKKKPLLHFFCPVAHLCEFDRICVPFANMELLNATDCQTYFNCVDRFV